MIRLYMSHKNHDYDISTENSVWGVCDIQIRLSVYKILQNVVQDAYLGCCCFILIFHRKSSMPNSILKLWSVTHNVRSRKTFPSNRTKLSQLIKIIFVPDTVEIFVARILLRQSHVHIVGIVRPNASHFIVHRVCSMRKSAINYLN